MSNEKALKVLLVDPSFSTVGTSESQGEIMKNIVIPLSVGYVGSYMKSKLPNIDLTILKTSSDIVEFIAKEKPDVLGVCNYLWNTNLSIRLSHYSREVNPKTFVIFGGPEINTKPVDRNNFIKKYSHVDMLIHHEGEVAFTRLMEIYLQEKRDVKKVRSRINELGNCFYIGEDGNFVAGPPVKRINDLSVVPSPYLTGLFDYFLKKGCYMPLIQTNRGCPYACTFCQEGSDYYSKLNYHTLDNVKKELDYIVQRVNPIMALYIVDSNLGQYKQDIEIAYYLKELKEKYNWPMFIASSTGKSQLSRIKKFAEILDGSLRISNAVQSLNNEVLDAIKRKNASTLEEFLKGLKMVSVPDIILPLPKETKKTFIDGLNRLLDTRAPIRFTVFHALLLSDTEMNDTGTVKNHKLKVKYRQHQNLTGKVAGKLFCETERNIVQTSTMSQEDVFESRKYVVLLDALLREEPLREIFYYLDSKDIDRSKLTISMYNNLNNSPIDIKECLDEYITKIVSETFDTEEEVLKYMEKHSEDYQYGRKGGDLLRYTQKLWIDHSNSFIQWIFQHLKIVVGNSEKIKKELDNLCEFLKFVYYERFQTHIKQSVIKKEFDFDILRWMENAPVKKLGDFEKKVTYCFNETKFSKLTKKDIWNSFGFNLDKNIHYQNYFLMRMYISKTRRRITRNDDIPVKQKLPLMADFAEKVGLSS